MKILVITVLLLFTLTSCGSKNSDEKDYWKLNEPELFVSDIYIADDKKMKTSSNQIKISKFSELRKSLKGFAGYRSFLNFKDLGSEVQFDIQTKCTYTLNETSTSFSAAFKDQVIYQKLYLYNYLPEEVLFDQDYEDQSKDYSCDFSFVAKNKINSQHSFEIKDLVMNTRDANDVKILARSFSTETSSEQISDAFIYKNKNSEKYRFNYTALDMRPDKTYNFKVTPNNITFLNPVVKCLGDENKFIFPSEEGEVTHRDLWYAFETKKFGTSFLKKCRVIGNLSSKSKSEYIEKSDELVDQPVLWTNYFDVIFERPIIKIKTLQYPPDLSYPKNTDDNLIYKAFSLVFTNHSKLPAELILPGAEMSYKANLTAIALKAQKPGYKFPTNNPFDASLYAESFQNFESEFYFTDENDLVVKTINLDANESKSIDLIVKKNFKCNFLPVHLKIKLDKTHWNGTEYGFKIEALKKHSIEDLIQINYFNQGKLSEAFPENFYLSDFLAENEVNHLQYDKKSDYAINSYVLRSNLGYIYDKDSLSVETYSKNILNFIKPIYENLPYLYYDNVSKRSGLAQIKFDENHCEELN